MQSKFGISEVGSRKSKSPKYQVRGTEYNVRNKKSEFRFHKKKSKKLEAMRSQKSEIERPVV